MARLTSRTPFRIPAGRVLLGGNRATLEQDARKHVDTPCLPEGHHLDGEELGHEPIPEKVRWNGRHQTHDGDDDEGIEANDHSENQSLQHL